MTLSRHLSRDELEDYHVGRTEIASALGISERRFRDVMAYHLPPGVEVVGQTTMGNTLYPIHGMHRKEAVRLRHLRETAHVYDPAGFARFWALWHSGGRVSVPCEAVREGWATLEDWAKDMIAHRDQSYLDEPLLMHAEVYRHRPHLQRPKPSTFKAWSSAPKGAI